MQWLLSNLRSSFWHCVTLYLTTPLWPLWSMTWTVAPSWARGPEISGPKTQKQPRKERDLIYLVCGDWGWNEVNFEWARHLQLGCERGGFWRRCRPSCAPAHCSPRPQSLSRTMQSVWSKHIHTKSVHISSNSTFLLPPHPPKISPNPQTISSFLQIVTGRNSGSLLALTGILDEKMSGFGHWF